MLPAALAERLQQAQIKVNAELDELLAGITDAEANHHPPPAEWNVRENLAHLIWSERYLQFTLWNAVGGDYYTPWLDNNPSHLVGLLATYPTISDLLDEFKRAQKATIAVVLALPESLLARKASYLLVGQNLLGFPDHAREHLDQIKTTLASARA
jgi:hypothetical protein